MNHRQTQRLRFILFTFIGMSTIVYSIGRTQARSSKSGAVPTVRILSPGNGWTALKTLRIQGSVVSPTPIKTVRLILNGNARILPLRNGRFSRKIFLAGGENYIRVEADNANGRGSARIRLLASGGRMDLRVILAWDADRTDVDLWVTDPNREKTFYAHRRSAIGGSLDVDITDGYGPETFTLLRAIPGEYLVQANYFGGKKPTMARVIVILYQGTAREKRKTFYALLRKKGKGTTIGRFRIE